MHVVVQTFGILILLANHKAYAACVFPFNATSSGETWTSADRGDLTVSDTMISGYHIEGNIGINFDFHCEENDGNTYLLRADQTQNIFNEITLFFLCLDIYRYSDTVFYYYIRNVQDTYVRAVIFPYKEVVPPMSEACQFEAQPHTFISIVKKDSTDLFNFSCPIELFAKFDNLTLLSSSGFASTNAGSCQGSNVDMCSDRTIVKVNNNCSATRTLSAGGSYNCLFNLKNNDVTYLSLWNQDTTVDGTNTFKFSCLAFVRSGDDVYATESPRQCTNTTNHTHTDTGLVLLFTSLSDTCLDQPPTTTEAPPPDLSFLLYLLLLPAALLLAWILLLILLLAVVCCKRYGCVCRRIPEWLKKRSREKALIGDKVLRSKFPKNKLSPLKAPPHDKFYFKPKRPIDISLYGLSFAIGSFPTLNPQDKIPTLYPDSVEDYMRGKMPRYPSGLSLYSIESVVFEHRKPHKAHFIDVYEPSNEEDTVTEMLSTSSEETDASSTTKSDI